MMMLIVECPVGCPGDCPTVATMDNFYEHIDIIFDNLYEKIGWTDELISCKEKLLQAYENDKGDRHGFLQTKKKSFRIDDDGYIIMCE